MSEPELIPHVGFLGTTFNSIKLDPFKLEGAATARSVFELDSTESTADGKWLYPAGASYGIRTGGSYDFRKLDQNNYSSISKAFESTAKVKVSVPLTASTKSSTAVKKTSTKIAETNITTIFSEYKIPKHLLSLNTYPASAAPKLNSSFKQRVKDLKILIRPDKDTWSYATYSANIALMQKYSTIHIPKLTKAEWNEYITNGMVQNNPTAFDDIHRFLADFGSHYAQEIVLGGVMSNSTEISVEDMQYFTSNSIDVSTEAEGTFKGVTGGASGGSSSSSSEEYRTRTESQTTKIEFVGGDPNLEDKEEWKDSLDNKPSVIEVRLRPLYELFTSDFFPDDPHISIKQDMMKYLTEGDRVETWSGDQMIGGQSQWMCNNVYALMNSDWDTDPLDFKRCHHRVVELLAYLKIETDASEAAEVKTGSKYRI